MTAKTLRQRHARAFIQLERYPVWVGWAIVGAYLGMIAIAIAVGAALISAPVGIGEGLIIVALMLFIGSRLRGLNNVIHECSHATLVRDRDANGRIGKFCACFTLASFDDYRREHLTHHSYIGDYERDLDLQGIERLGLHDPLTPQVIARHMVTPLILRHLPYYLSIDLSLSDGRLAQVFKLFLLGSVVASTIAFPLTTILFVVFPYVLFYTALNYWADCLDHAGLVQHGDDLFASRNILAPTWFAVLFFPRNDHYHLVHHLFPNVPARHLPDVHDKLLDDTLYRSAENAVSQSDDVIGKASPAPR